MKKISLYIMSLLTVGFAACTEDFNKDVAAPQSWDEENAAGKVSLTASAISPVDLNSVTEDSVAVCTFQTSIAEDATVLKYDVLIDKTHTLNVGNTGKASVAELQKMVEELFGRRPEERTFVGTVRAYVDVNGQGFRGVSEKINIIVTPSAPVVESAYYLIGDMNNWIDEGKNIDKLIIFNHSDKDVYEDPEFTVVAKVDNNCYWKIIPKSCVDAVKNGIAENVLGAGVLGSAIDGDTSEEGTLVSEDPQAMKIEDAGYYKITINILDATFKVEALGESVPMPETMFINGSAYSEGWTWDMAAAMVQVNNGGNEALAGQFWLIQHYKAGDEIKFSPEAAWSGKDFGVSSVSPEAIAYAEITGDDNIKIGKTGWYLIMVTTSYTDDSKSALKYKVDMMEPVVYLMGPTSANGWTAKDPAAKFTIAGDEFVSPAFVASDNLRMFVDMASVGGDWWRAEFNIFNNKIEYRANGGDQAAVPVQVGQKAYLNFMTKTGRVE